MTDNKLKSLAERIERLMDERDGIQSDIRDIYAEAKSAGYVPKVLRKAITRKRMEPDKRDEEDAILELYEGALSPSMRKAVEMAARNASAREIEAETGIDQATVARSVSLNNKSETTKPVPDAPVGGNERADTRPASGVAPTTTADYLNANSVLTESGCLEWTGPKDRDGYGRASLGGEKFTAHRLVWSLGNGSIPDGMLVCHRCDNPSCVNLTHLFLGTNADNAADKVAKGRQARGDGTPLAKLTEDQARAIIEAEGTISDIARQFGMSRTLVSRIRSGDRWSHLGGTAATPDGPGTSPNSFVATPSAPHLDEPRDTATQGEALDDRKREAIAYAIMRDTMGAMENAAAPTHEAGAVAEPSAAQRVAAPVLTPDVTTADPGPIPTFLRRSA